MTPPKIANHPIKIILTVTHGDRIPDNGPRPLEAASADSVERLPSPVRQMIPIELRLEFKGRALEHHLLKGQFGSPSTQRNNRVNSVDLKKRHGMSRAEGGQQAQRFPPTRVDVR